MSPRAVYGHALPELDLDDLRGALVVVEGPDSSGRTTQIKLLSRWLEQEGFAVEQTGLKRSQLVADELEQAQRGNVLSPRTMSLFYATDFFDLLENRVVPALKAGAVVLADRYIYTLMARDLARGANLRWLQSLYAPAVVPDAVFLLEASPERLMGRTLDAKGGLDYWESGMDLGLSRDWSESFQAYQSILKGQFDRLCEEYHLEVIDADRSILEVNRELKERVAHLLGQLRTW